MEGINLKWTLKVYTIQCYLKLDCYIHQKRHEKDLVLDRFPYPISYCVSCCPRGYMDNITT